MFKVIGSLIISSMIGLVNVSIISNMFVSNANAYSQDPRSCADPRTIYPSNPPCYKLNAKELD